MTKNDYQYIQAWGQMMNSDQRYIWEQVQKARADKAPKDATYFGADKQWHTFSEVTSENTKEIINNILKRS